MRNTMKRIVAIVLLVCTLASFVVPATFADGGNSAENIKYDFELYNHTDLFSGAADANGHKFSKEDTNIKTAYGNNSWNWKLEAVADGVSTANDMKFFKKSGEGLRLLNFTADDWMALRIRVGAAGKYSVSLTGGTTSASYNYDATAWVVAAPAEGAMSVTDVAAAMVDSNKLDTASITYSDKTDTLGEYTFAAGEYILILSVSNSTRSSIADINLTLLEETTDTTASTGANESTVATGTTDTTAPAGEPVNLDFELYNQEQFSSVVTGAGEKLNHTPKTTIDNAYAAGTHNWKVENVKGGIGNTKNNFKFFNTNGVSEGLRVLNSAGKWMALRIMVPEAGSYELTLTGSVAENSYAATFYTVAAPAEGTMAEADVEAAMIDANKIGVANVTTEENVVVAGIHNFAQGENILIIQVNADRASWTDIDLTPKTEEDDSTITTESTGETESIETTEASETTEAPQTTESTESNDTTAGEVEAYKSNTFDFELYKKAEFSSAIDGNYNKYHKTAVQKAVKDAYPSANNWIVETVAEGVSLENLQFNTKEGFSMRVGANNWAALRLNVTQAGTFEIVLNSIYAQAFTTALWVFPAPANTLTPAEVVPYMIDPANLLGQAEVTAGQPAVAGEYTFAEGEYIVVMASKGDRVSFSSIVLAEPGSTSTQPSEPEAPAIPSQPNVPSGSIFASNTFDFELYNNPNFSDVITGDEGIKYRKVNSNVKDAYPSINNWVVEGYEIYTNGELATNVQSEDKLLFVKKDPAFRLNIGIGNWVAIRLNVAQAGQYDIVFNSTKEYSAEAWLIPATAETMSRDMLKSAMKDTYKLGDVRLNKDTTSFNAATYNFAAGEYVLILKAGTERINLQNIQLTKVGEIEKPEEDTRPEYENKPGYFDMRLFNYKGFDVLAGEYIKYNKAASLMTMKYPAAINWILEAVSANVTTKDDVQFIGAKGEGLRLTADENVNGEWMALRLNNTKTGKYDLVINSNVGIYSGKVYLFPATAEKMTTQQIAALMTDANLMGNIKFSSEMDSYNLGEYEFVVGEYIIVLQADETRVTVDSIEIIDHYVEKPKDPVDQMIYDLDLVKMDPVFKDKGFNNWYSKSDSGNGQLRVYQKIAQMYKAGTIDWKFEATSNSKYRINCRTNHSQIKASTNFMEEPNAWYALRLEAPGAGTYDIRINSDEKSGVVADIYLIPAKTGIEMTNEEIEAGMNEKNLLLKGGLLSGNGDFYLGEYTFGAEYEYVLVMKITRGKKLYMNHIKVTKDGLLADTEVKKLPTYNGVVYDFDIGDEFTGILQPLSEYRYDMPTPKENGYKSPYEQIKAFWNSGKINWKWIAGSDDLVEYDENMNTYPNDYNRFYSETGMYIYSRPGSWVAFKIKSPGEGDFTLTMNHAVAANDGTVAVYILPADTPNEEIYNTTDPSNRVGKVVLTKPDGSAGKKDGFESFVGYWNFEAGKEYILVLEAYAASQFSATMSNMNISNIVMQKGIHEYKTENAKTVKPITVKERVLATSDLGNGNVAIFEMNGMDYYLTQLEGGTINLYNLTTGELEKENYISTARPRHMAVAPDGKVWMTGAGKFLVCYDPQENTITKTKTFMPKEYKHNGPSYMTITPEGVIYFTLNQRGNIIEYNPETKQFRDLGYFVDPLDYTHHIFYHEGYLYVTAKVGDSHNSIVKYNIATAQVEKAVNVLDQSDDSLTGLSMLGDDILVVGGKTRDNDHAIAFNIHTMEQVDLGLPGSVSKQVTSPINGKQYMILSTYGLYEYDIETKEITKVPGFAEMTGTGFRGGDQTSFGKSWAMINGDLCLLSNDSQVTSCPRVVNLTKKEYYRWTDLTRDANGGGSRIISFTETEPGAGELVMGHWNAEFISTYNIYTGELSAMDSAGQTDSIGYYKGILYGGCYSATVLVELHRETEEIIQRFKLDHELTGQKRLLSMETGGDHVFVGSIPDSYQNGGALTVYNTITGQWYYERNIVPNQSIIDEAYSQELVFIASSLKAGDNAADAGDSAVIVAYDYLNRKALATLDPRDYIPGLASPVVYIYGLTADPNTEENGRIWAVVSDTLFCFTFDRETNKFDVQVVLSLGKTNYNISSGVGRSQRKIRFIPEKNQLYVMLSDTGMQKIVLEDWNAPIGEVKMKSYETLMGYKPEDYIIAEDGNFYFGNDADLMMIPLNVTDEDWAIAEKMDAQIKAIKDGEITLASESAIRTARSDYENMSWRYKALVQNLELLQEVESDILECKIDAGILEAGQIDADDYPAMLALHEEYDGLTTARQKRYVKNYKNLKEAYELSSQLNDERCAAAMQEKINKLKDIMPIESLEKEPQVVAVRAEFDAMPGRQRILVDTKILEEAEAQIAVLRAELVKQVEALIQAIPAEITLEAEPAILAAREGVDKLTALERKQVSYSKLETAESKLRNLKNAMAKAEEVDQLIKAIGIVTLGDGERIAAARKAYNSLNETGRSFLKRGNKLLRAEFIYSALQSWGIPVIVVADAAIVFAVLWFVPSLHNKVFKGKKKEEAPAEETVE